jgi:protein-disulfide isomerase
MPLPPTRWLLLLVAALLAAACGPEAPPRAARPTSAPNTERMRPSGVTVVPAATAEQPAGTAAANRDPRSLGDPNAPITVVEYSDFQ